MRTATIYNFLLEATLMASIAIVLMIPVRKFLRGPVGNRAIYFAWLLVAVRLLCPLALPNPAINEIRSAYSPDQAVRPIGGQIQVRLSDASREAYFWAEERSQSGRGDPLTSRLFEFYGSIRNGMLPIRLMRVYLLGVALAMGWFIASNLRFRHRLRADRIEPVSGKLKEQYDTLCARRGVKAIPVYFTDPLPSACLVGVFRPYIALPLTAAPQDVIQVLEHEVCHLKGRDHLWALLRLACCVVHWFNPLVWLAANMSRTDGELACDDRVVKGMDEAQKKAYANILVLAAARRNAPGVAVLATGMIMTGRRLKTRVRAILRNGQVKRVLATAFSVTACLLLVGAFATAEYHVPPAIPAISQSAGFTPRSVADEADAIAYFRELAQMEYLQWDLTNDLTFEVTRQDGEYSVSALREENGPGSRAIFSESGHVRYLNTDATFWDYSWSDSNLYQNDAETQEEVARYLLDFADTLNPGAADRIEAMQYADEDKFGKMHFLTFMGLAGGDDVYTKFVAEVTPEVRVIQYAEGRTTYGGSGIMP